jgi:hypothetical protein
MPCCARVAPHRVQIAARDAQRVVVGPVDLAVVTASQRPGAVVMLVRFPTPWGNQSIAGAYLLVRRDDAAREPSRSVQITVARILEPWVGADVTWGRLPRLSPAEISTTVTGSATDTLRIDVTRIVERWADARSDDRGIAIMADAAGPFSSDRAPDGSRGLAPRLDVYVR